MTHLLIVESPAKAKTIKKYLGKDFEVMASYGHVRDLLPKSGAVDPTNQFAMKYQLVEKNQKHIDAISKALKKADHFYLATDPDREGEAIAWHLKELMTDKKLLHKKTVQRVVFHEITKNAITEAMKHPRDISMDLVNAQQTRRALDYLVGFTLSPLLWKKIQRGLSAGRVQSPALRLIVEREEEIEKFVQQEYWTMTAQCETTQKTKKPESFTARLVQYQQEKLTQFSLSTQQYSEQIKQHLLLASKGKLTVINVQKKQRKRQASPPFTTSTLQQESAQKLGFTAQRTMRTAQQLYESGLITYMRTDAVYLAHDAVKNIRDFIQQHFGQDYLPNSPRVYRNKSKNAQEAHEAIRPTDVLNSPEKLKQLPVEQQRLYQLIWKRTVACQMIHALLDTVSVDLDCGGQGIFRATGSVIAHPGFMRVYLASDPSIEATQENPSDQPVLPVLTIGDSVSLKNILAEQHFTEPPPRYSEASLIKILEEYGIGRPSTYASIISTIQQRHYAELQTKRFHPTDIGRIVSKFLNQHFSRYVDYGFTASLEDDLDAIARGEKPWINLLENFWLPFKTQIKAIEKNVSRQETTHELIDKICPKCHNKPLSIRLGRRGKFIGCTGYPDCDYACDLNNNPEVENDLHVPEVIPDRQCPQCESPLHVRHGRYGKFIGCSHYPTCKFMEPLEKPANTGITCPACHQGHLLKRKSRFGKIFYSCETYPSCRYAVWNEPANAICPTCHWPIMTIKTTKRKGTEQVCPQKNCGFSKNITPPEKL